MKVSSIFNRFTFVWNNSLPMDLGKRESERQRLKAKLKKSVLPQNEDGPSTYSRFELVDSRFWSPHRKKFSLGSIRYY